MNAIRAAVFVAALAFSTNAFSQANCRPTDVWLAFVKERYGEEIIWSGIGADERTVYLVTANPTTGSWTIGVRRAETTSICTYAGGYFYLHVPPTARPIE